MPKSTKYRGCRIETFVGVQVGYSDPAGNVAVKTATPKGFLVHIPGERRPKFQATMREAKAYIDQHLEAK